MISGDHEVILDGTMLAEVARLNPGLELEVIAGAAHCVRRDRGDAFHAVLDPWLAAHAG